MSNTFAKFIPEKEDGGIKHMTITAYVGKEAEKHSRRNIQLTFSLVDSWKSEYITLTGYQVEQLMACLLDRLSGDVQATTYSETKTIYKDHTVKGETI